MIGSLRLRLRRRREAPTASAAEPDRIRVRDLLDEAVSSIASRPGRSLMTMAGTVLGIASFVAILGMTTTAAGQITVRFNELEATQVIVTDLRTSQAQQGGYEFPEHAGELLHPLNGVVDAGVYYQVPLSNEATSTHLGAQPEADADGRSASLSVYAVEAGTLRAADASVSSGVTLDDVHSEHRLPVAVLGQAAASALSIPSVETSPTVFIGNDPYTVIGILADVARLPELASAILVPQTVALERYGPPTPDRPARMLVQTELGAAELLAVQAPLALRPDDPTTLGAASPPDWSGITDDVTSSVDTLLLGLAAIALLVGCLAITNTTMVAVMERTGEIGLRQALGATPRQIAGQFLTESTLIGAIGGLIGNAAGIALVLAVAVARGWTPVLDPALSVLAPLVGLGVGMIAGVYPAIRAARIEPSSALQR